MSELPVRVGILVGSESDLPVMEACVSVLESLGIGSEIRVLSAHRTPDATAEYARDAEGRGLQVIVAAAGMAAALPGTVAAHTTLPVLGVPLAASALGGVDALLSIAQMPPGVPVGTLAIGKAGAKNAAILATQIIALSDEHAARAIASLKEDLRSGKRV